VLYERWRWALRSRLVGGGFKQPGAASAKSCGGERPRLKGVTSDHVMWGLERRVKTNLLMTYRNTTTMASKPELLTCSGNSVAETYLLATRRPVYRGRDSNPGFRMELENLVGDGKGKGTSGRTMRPKVLMHRPGSHCSIVARKRSNVRGAKGAGHPRQDGVNGRPEELLVLAEAGRLLLGWHEPDEVRASRPDL